MTEYYDRNSPSRDLEDRVPPLPTPDAFARETLERVRTQGLEYVRKRPVLSGELDYGIRKGLYTEGDVKKAQEDFLANQNQ